VGLGGHLVIHRIGRWLSLAVGAMGWVAIKMVNHSPKNTILIVSWFWNTR